MQACDLLLEQINACAAPPGKRPEMEFPAGIMRKAQPEPAPRLFCEIPALVPESPFDVALGLGFNHRQSVHPTDVSEGGENPTEPRHVVSSPEYEATTSGTNCSSEVAVCNGAWDEEETCGGSAAHPRKESDRRECDDDANDSVGVGPEPPDMEEGAVAPDGDVDGDERVVARAGERRGGKCSRGTCTSPERRSGAVPAGHGQQMPVKIISVAAYNRERAAKAGSEGGAGSSATRRRAMCRIEAFVIRSRSARATPMQQQQSEALKKPVATKSIAVEMEGW